MFLSNGKTFLIVETVFLATQKIVGGFATVVFVSQAKVEGSETIVEIAPTIVRAVLTIFKAVLTIFRADL